MSTFPKEGTVDYYRVCPTCKKVGSKSVVRIPGIIARTILKVDAYWDEHGRAHVHDPNTETTTYACNMGHSWTEVIRKNCWCGWPVK